MMLVVVPCKVFCRMAAWCRCGRSAHRSGVTGEGARIKGGRSGRCLFQSLKRPWYGARLLICFLMMRAEHDVRGRRANLLIGCA